MSVCYFLHLIIASEWDGDQHLISTKDINNIGWNSQGPIWPMIFKEEWRNVNKYLSKKKVEEAKKRNRIKRSGSRAINVEIMDALQRASLNIFLKLKSSMTDKANRHALKATYLMV